LVSEVDSCVERDLHYAQVVAVCHVAAALQLERHALVLEALLLEVDQSRLQNVHQTHGNVHLVVENLVLLLVHLAFDLDRVHVAQTSVKVVAAASRYYQMAPEFEHHGVCPRLRFVVLLN